MRFEKLDISTLSDIEAVFASAEDPVRGWVLLRATFRGHAFNSHGQSSFCHIKSLMAGNMVASVSDAVILDFTNLRYEWGEEMAHILFYCSNHPIETGLKIPVAVITSDLNREGLISLVRDEMNESPNKWLHESLEEAVAAIGRKIAGEGTE